MADELVDRLAARIKVKEEKAALATRVQLHKAEFIQANCLTFFKQLSDELRMSVDGLNSALAGSASADLPAQHSVDRAGTIIVVSKEDFPSAHAQLGLNAKGLTIAYALASSERKDSPNRHQISGLWKFDVDEDNNLILVSQPGQSIPQKLSTPTEVCNFVMTRIFSV